MNSSDFWYGVGDIFTETFKLFGENSGLINWIFIVTIAAFLAGWLVMQFKYNSVEMKESGELK